MLFTLGWLIGIFIGSFLFVQPLIILFFSMPYTLKLKKIKVINSVSPIMIRSSISIFVQAGIFIGIFYLIKYFSFHLLIGFYVGVGIVSLLGISKIFKNKENVADYMERNYAYIDHSYIKLYLETFIDKESESKFKIAHVNTMIKKTDIEF